LRKGWLFPPDQRRGLISLVTNKGKLFWSRIVPFCFQGFKTILVWSLSVIEAIGYEHYFPDNDNDKPQKEGKKRKRR